MNQDHPGIDPSLRAAEPPLDTLADGFSPAAEPAGEQSQDPPPTRAEQPLTTKSPF
jgi:hypothetical protein